MFKSKNENNIDDVEVLWQNSRPNIEAHVFSSLFRHIEDVRDQFAENDNLQTVENDADESEDMEDLTPIAEMLEEDDLYLAQ